MNMIFRFGKSVGLVAATYALILLMIFVVWRLAGVESGYRYIIKHLLSSEFASDPEFAKEMAIDLGVFIQVTVLSTFGTLFIASIIWLAIASFVRIDRPGDARTWVWAWFIVFLIGVAVNVGVPTYIFTVVTDLLRLDQLLLTVILSLAVFSLCFLLIGSILATPRHMRTAIPLISKIYKKL